MKGKITILLFLTIILFSFTKEDKKTYYPTGELESEYFFDSLCNCHHLITYYKSGQKKGELTYLRIDAIKTVIDGPSINYFEDGTLALYTLWRNGIQTGKAYSNYPDGTRAFNKFYKDGYKAGEWHYFNEDGSTKYVEYYEERKTKWDSNDDYMRIVFYNNNRPAYEVTKEKGVEVDLKVFDSSGYRQLIKIKDTTGKKMFVSNCGMCHSLKIDIVGPKLKDITKLRDRDWLKKMIRNGMELVNANDSIAVSVFKQWNRTEHPVFERLSESEVELIISYLNK